LLEGPLAEYDKWVHLAVTIGNGEAALYVNGVIVDGFGVDVKPSDLGDSYQNFLGRSQFSADAYFTGYIADFVLYNKALSAADIQKLMNSDFRAIRGAVTLPATIAPAVEPAEAPAAEAAPVTPAPAAPATPAPPTGDTGIIVFAVIMTIAAAGVYVFRKKTAVK
jgi:hypothetical protein